MWGAHGVEICENCFERESVLFISTQFSILYTSMYSPAEAATKQTTVHLTLRSTKYEVRTLRLNFPITAGPRTTQ